ncbi:xylulokinase [Effusibacillus consociatus]|uniref:Xylulose kinase n=1 Tax=Effusibacillus consociatus TaxID=1117041 RepID=A0ABV9Q0L2_9BACL
MSRELLVGIDIGTQGTKAIAIDLAGVIQGTGYSSYQFEVPQPGWSEQHPDLWWNGVIDALTQLWEKGIRPQDVQGIGAAGQMHSSVLLSEKKEVLGTAILWNDVRTAVECREIESLVGEKRIYDITRNSVLPGFTAPKLLWIRKHQPERYERIRHVLLPKDYIVFRLSGELSGDVSDASGTGLFNVADRQWADDVIRELGIPRTWMPEVHESSTVVGYVTGEAAKVTGLKKGTPIVAGAGDNAAAALGNGIFKEGTGLVSVGTSGIVLMPLQRIPDVSDMDPDLKTLHMFCHCLPDTWHAMGVTLSAGMSLRWLRDSFKFASYDQMLAGTAEIAPGAEDLFFLPYLNGERTPHNDPNARGVFFGMHFGHTMEHFVRAVLEGVAYSLRDCLELIKRLQPHSEIKEMFLTGGAVKSPEWSQILADVLTCRLIGYEEREGPAFGAALLAGLGTGIWKQPQELPGQSGVPRITEVNSEIADRYDRLYPIYRDLYPSLRPVFQTLHARK